MVVVVFLFLLWTISIDAIAIWTKRFCIQWKVSICFSFREDITSQHHDADTFLCVQINLFNIFQLVKKNKKKNLFQWFTEWWFSNFEIAIRWFFEESNVTDSFHGTISLFHIFSWTLRIQKWLTNLDRVVVFNVIYDFWANFQCERSFDEIDRIISILCEIKTRKTVLFNAPNISIWLFLSYVLTARQRIWTG